jgi:putative solute:sodium symporter small subunit
MESVRPFDARAYWRGTLRRILVLLLIWVLVGPVLGILLVVPLNNFSLAGVPLGFWIAQQGSIYVFVVLIFVNAWLADRADHASGVHETPETTQHTYTH